MTTPTLYTTTTYYVDATTPGGCVGLRGAVVVTVNPNVSAQISIVVDTNRVCENNMVNFMADTLNGGINPTIEWRRNGVTVSTGTSTSWQNVVPQAGDIFTCVITSQLLCVDPRKDTSNAITIEVVPRPVPTIEIAADKNPICKGTMVNFTSQVTNDGLASIYEWQLNGASVSSTTTYNNTSLGNGDIVKCILTSNKLCATPATVSDSITMVVNNPPQPSITPSTAAGCDLLQVDYQMSPGLTYRWSFNGTDTVEVKDASYSHTYRYIDGNPQVVGLRVIDQNGCYMKTTVTATAHEQPATDFAYAPDVISNLSPFVEVVDQTAGGSVNSWSWTFSDGGTGTGRTMEHKFPKAGDYTITLKSENTVTGCKDSTSKVVSVIEDYALYIPDAFSPNGDGNNDEFKANGIGVRTFDMWIYDRWGSMLYHSGDINEGWNGSAYGKSELVQVDVYVYKIIATDFKQRKHEYVGKISLIR
jgi:gliding motility-associated-like protein